MKGTHVDISVTYIDLLDGVGSSVSWSVLDAVSQELPVDGVPVRWSPADVQRRRAGVVGHGDHRLPVGN